MIRVIKIKDSFVANLIVDFGQSHMFCLTISVQGVSFALIQVRFFIFRDYIFIHNELNLYGVSSLNSICPSKFKESTSITVDSKNLTKGTLKVGLDSYLYRCDHRLH